MGMTRDEARRFKIRTVDDLRRFYAWNDCTEIADRPGEIWFARRGGDNFVVYTRQCPECDERLLRGNRPCWRCGPKCPDCAELLIFNNCGECNPGGHAAQRGANNPTWWQLALRRARHEGKTDRGSRRQGGEERTHSKPDRASRDVCA